MKISETVEFLHEVGGVTIRLTLQQVGRDLLVLLTGGDAPHVPELPNEIDTQSL